MWSTKIRTCECINSTVINISGSIQGREESQMTSEEDGWMTGWGSVTHPSTAGERSGLVLPLDRYLLWLCRRGGRPGPQCSPAPSRPPMGPPKPAGTDPPIGPPPNPPRSLKPPKRPPGSRGSVSGLSLSVVNGRSSNSRCHSYRQDGMGWVRVWREWEFETMGKEERKRKKPNHTITKGNGRRQEAARNKKTRDGSQRKGR